MKKVTVISMALLIVGAPLVYWLLTNPSNSVALMQALRNADDPTAFYVNGADVDEQHIAYIQEHFDVQAVSQFTVLEFDEKAYVVETTPGTRKMNIIAIEELPEDMRAYLTEQRK